LNQSSHSASQPKLVCSSLAVFDLVVLCFVLRLWSAVCLVHFVQSIQVAEPICLLPQQTLWIPTGIAHGIDRFGKGCISFVTSFMINGDVINGIA